MTPPQKDMEFVDRDDLTLQFALSAYSIDTLLGALTDAKMVQFTIPHDILYDAIGININTDYFLTLIPELWETYGGKDIDLTFTLLDHSELAFNASTKSVNTNLNLQIDWNIINDDKSKTLAFTSTSDLEADMSLMLFENKTVSLNLLKLALATWAVTNDQCDVKDDTSVQSNLNGLLSLIVQAGDSIIPMLGLKLPELGFPYFLMTTYTDEGVELGINLA